MIIYNVSIKIKREVSVDWLRWMKEVHVPDVLACGIFSDASIRHLLEFDETEWIPYSIQYSCKNMTDFKRYQSEYAPALQADHTKRYKNQFLASRTLMEVVG